MRYIFTALFTLILSVNVLAQTAKDFSNGFTNTESEASSPAHEVPSSINLPTAGYTLGGGDKVRLTIFGEDDLTGEYDVDGTGVLALPLIGNVNVLNKTLREAETLITKQYANGYLVNPRVSLEVLNFRPFFILGEVNKPGSYPYVNQLTVINAVALAGGYTPRAKTGYVLIRRAEDAKREEVEAPEDAKVFPGDVLRVDERFF